MSTDRQLCSLISSAFVIDERLSAQPVHVTVTDGVVTLDGTVQSFRRKLAAHEIATQFDDVRELHNNLAVEHSYTATDADVASFVRSSLEADADITKETITVSVKQGTVTLSGNVVSPWERAQAEDIARSAKGVRDVHNLLLCDGSEKAADEQMSEQIRSALTHARGLRDAEIQVAISHVALVLSGEVDHLWQKEMAQGVAERFRPMVIQNDIVVRRERVDS